MGLIRLRRVVVVDVVNVVVDEVVVRRILVVDGRVRRVGRIRLVVVELVDVVLVVVVVEVDDVGRRVRRVRRVGRVLLCRRVVVDVLVEVLVAMVVNVVVVVVDDSVVGANRFSVIGLFVTCAVLPA